MRMPIGQISTLGRVTQGVRLINLKNEQKVSSMCLIIADEESNNESTDANLSTTESVEEVQVEEKSE